MLTAARRGWGLHFSADGGEAVELPGQQVPLRAAESALLRVVRSGSTARKARAVPDRVRLLGRGPDTGAQQLTRRTASAALIGYQG